MTERLCLARWEDRFRDDFARWMSDPELIRYVRPWPMKSAEVAEHHAQSMQSWETRGFGKRAILDRFSGAWLGFVELSIAGPGKGCRENDVEIGYFLVRSAWGRGIATEAAAAVRDAAFSRHGLAELIGRHRVENTASARVLAKTGFSFVRDHVFPDGVVVHVYRLRRAEWQRRSRPAATKTPKQHKASAPTTASSFATEKPAA